MASNFSFNIIIRCYIGKMRGKLRGNPMFFE